MAIESLATESIAPSLLETSVRTGPIPGICNLLIDADSAKNPELVQRAAENAAHSLMPGLAALGRILFAAIESDLRPGYDDIKDLACLISEIADIQDNLNEVERAAAYKVSVGTRTN